MGLRLNVDLESHLGPTQEAYVEIDSIKLSRPNGRLRFSTTLWIDEKASKQFYRNTSEEAQNGSSGLLANNLLYFEDENSDGTEISFPIHFNVPFTRAESKKVKVYEDKVVEEKVPYVSFDKDGNEVTKYRVTSKTEKVEVGEEEVVTNNFDYSVFKNPTDFIHEVLVKEYSKVIPKDKIKIV